MSGTDDLPNGGVAQVVFTTTPPENLAGGVGGGGYVVIVKIPDLEIEYTARCPECHERLEPDADGWECKDCLIHWDHDGCGGRR